MGSKVEFNRKGLQGTYYKYVQKIKENVLKLLKENTVSLNEQKKNTNREMENI